MKKSLLISLMIFSAVAVLKAQDKPVKFTVEVSTDSILMGNYFEVKFTLENADGQNFEAPDFSESFNVVSGPNFSSSFSIMNGRMTQSQTITYYLEPRDIGSYYILPANVTASGEILETAPIEVMVVPNPDGIKQTPSGQMQQFRFDWGSPFGEGEDFPGFRFDLKTPFGNDFEFPLWDLKEFQLEPNPEDEQQQEKQAAPKKKKRKTIRI